MLGETCRKTRKRTVSGIREQEKTGKTYILKKKTGFPGPKTRGDHSDSRRGGGEGNKHNQQAAVLLWLVIF
jgi:hypothetical protein